MSFFGNLLESFNGKGARRDIDKGIGAVNANTEKGVGAIREGAAGAQGYLRPYVEQGGRAFGLYGDTLGVNGLDARNSAQDIYTSDPILQKMRELDAKKAGWAFNARGGYGSGAHALADSRANLENYGNWQDRLDRMGQQGQAAAGTAAGVSQREGEGIAGVYDNTTNALANLYGERAKTQNTFAQNLLGAGAVAARAFGFGNKIG